MSGHTHTQGCSNSVDLSIQTDAPTLQSFINSNQCMNNLWSYSFFFFRFFFSKILYSVIYLQQKSLFNYYISFFFKKKNHMVQPITAGPGGKNRPYKASVWEWNTSVLVRQQFASCFFLFIWLFSCRLWSQTPFSLVRESPGSRPCVSPQCRFQQWVRFGDMLMRNQREVTCFALSTL